MPPARRVGTKRLVRLFPQDLSLTLRDVGRAAAPLLLPPQIVILQNGSQSNFAGPITWSSCSLSTIFIAPKNRYSTSRRAILQELFIRHLLLHRPIFLKSINVLCLSPPGNLRDHLFITSIEDHSPYVTRRGGFCNYFHFSSMLCHPRGGLAQEDYFTFPLNQFRSTY